MNPLIPHFSSECLENIGQGEIKWPKILKEKLIEDNINFVIQINGKKKALLEVKRDIDEKSILKITLVNIKTKNFLKDKKIKKIIFVPNRLLNIIL